MEAWVCVSDDSIRGQRWWSEVWSKTLVGHVSRNLALADNHLRLADWIVVRVSEELAAKRVSDEIIESSHTRSGRHLAHFILSAQTLENNSSVTHLSPNGRDVGSSPYTYLSFVRSRTFRALWTKQHINNY